MVSLKGFKLWKRKNQMEQELRALAIGMNSTVDFTQDLHIVMLDYDIDDFEKVTESVWELQEFWGLADAHIIRTAAGYHAFFFWDLVPYARLRQIIDYARFVDPLYKYISRFYNHKTIRVSGKYKKRDLQYIGIIRGIRQPTLFEQEIGNMKLEEYMALSGVKISKKVVDGPAF
jgi:hypothetical protein